MRALYVLVLLLVTLSCATDLPEGVGAPSIAGTTQSNDSFDLTDLRGKYVLIDFWGSWCGPCLKEAPSLVSLYNTYNEKQFVDADGFEVVSIALEKKEDRTAAVVEKFGFLWPYQLVEQTPYVRMSTVASAYGVTDIPAKFLISPNGEIIASKTDIETLRALLESKLK